MILQTEYLKEGCIYCGSKTLVEQKKAKPGQEKHNNHHETEQKNYDENNVLLLGCKQIRLKCLFCKKTQMKMKTFK